MSYLLPDASLALRFSFPYSLWQSHFAWAHYTVLGSDSLGLWWLVRICVKVDSFTPVKSQSGSIWMSKVILAVNNQIGFAPDFWLIITSFIAISIPIFPFTLPVFLPVFKFLLRTSPKTLLLISATDCSVPVHSLGHESLWFHYLFYSFIQVHYKENYFNFEFLQGITEVIELSITN